MTPSDDKHAEQRAGVMAGLIAYTMWGVFPVYFKLVGSVAPLEVLAHRVIWAVPFGALIIGLRHQWAEVRRAFTHREMLPWLALAALSISTNWLIYIWAVQNDRIFEASLGYYINPLMYVATGMLFFGERLSRLQTLAVVLAAIGVSVLTISGGEFPWVALSLAVLFAAYGIIRKKVVIGAMPGLFVETIVLSPVALGILGVFLVSQTAAIGSSGAAMNSLLVLAGPLTVIPLLFFAIAARKLTLTTVGFMQFLAPTLQFCTGLYYGEQLTTAHLICFGFIWTAVAAFSVDAVLAARKKPPPAEPAGA